MSPPSASPLTIYGIAMLAVAVAALVVAGAKRIEVALGILVLMAAQFFLASSGILRHWERRPPPMPLLIAASLVATTILAFSPIGARMASTLSFAVLIGAQAFRLPLELVMHHAAMEGTMPPQMSYGGANFDILTGATAILVAIAAATGRAPRWLLIAWNFLGSLLLLNIVIIAVRSMPMIRAYGDDRLNTWIAYPPFVWLPGVLVPAALLGHLLIWRKLAAPAKGAHPARGGSFT